MTCTAWRALAAGLCWAALAAAHAARAEEGGVQPSLTVNSDVTLSANTLPLDSDHHQYQNLTGPSNVVHARSDSLRPSAGGASAYAYAGYGVLGAYAAGSVRNDPLSAISGLSFGYTSGSASARFQDVFTVDAGILNGTVGSLVVPWAFTGAGASASLAGPFPRTDQEGSASWTLDLTSTRLDGTFLGSTQASGGYVSGDDPISKQYYSGHTLPRQATLIDSFGLGSGLPALWREIPIVFGQPTVITASLYTTFNAYAGNRGLDVNDPTYLQLRSAEAAADLGHTLRWGGVSQVLDANGVAVTTWALSAASGTDYRVANTSAVPEPHGWVLMALGLLPMFLRRQRGSAMR
jgi:hypothetical protein